MLFLDGSVLLCVLSAIPDFLMGDTKTMSEERETNQVEHQEYI